jgi:hypothetical protein
MVSMDMIEVEKISPALLTTIMFTEVLWQRLRRIQTRINIFGASAQENTEAFREKILFKNSIETETTAKPRRI